MSQADSALFACPTCGRKYRPRPEWAGRKLQCACGAEITAPPMPVAPRAAFPAEAVVMQRRASIATEQDGGLYDLGPSEQPAKPKAPPPAAPPAAPAPHASPATVAAPAAPAHPAPASASAPLDPRLLNLRPELRDFARRLKPEEPQIDPAELPMPRWQVILCPCLIAAGVIASIIEAMYFHGSPHAPPKPLATALPSALATMLANVLLMIGGVYLVSLALEEGLYDRLDRMAYKIAAIGLLPGPIGTMVNYAVAYGDPGGMMASIFVSMCLYTLLFRLLFKSPILQAMGCGLGVLVIRAIIQYVMWRIEGARTGSEI